MFTQINDAEHEAAATAEGVETEEIDSNRKYFWSDLLKGIDKASVTAGKAMNIINATRITLTKDVQYATKIRSTMAI